MAGFTREEQEAIILEFFGAEDASGTPLCPRCGEELRIESSVAGFFGLQLEVRCPGCSERFSWGQPQPERPWKELHLRYFAERHLMGESIICPFDDCLVACAEFQGGVLQFNCPYCNRRGAVELDRE